VPETTRKYTPPTGRVISFRLTLNPTLAQEKQFHSHVGAVRFTYNWTLALLRDNYEKRLIDPLVEHIPVSRGAILKQWTQAKDAVAPWWKENAKEAYDTGIDNAVAAYQNFFASQSGKRLGPKMSYPKFRKKNVPVGCLFNITVQLQKQEKTVKLSRIGHVRYLGDTGSIKWLLANGSRITQGRLKYDSTRWTLVLTLRVPDELAVRYYQSKYKRDVRKGKDKLAVGVDLGLKAFATQSDGLQVPNPRFLRKAEKRLKRANRSLARKRNSYVLVKDELTGQEYKQWSKRRQLASQNLAKQHARVYNLRNEFAHQYSTWLVKRYDTIAVESLNVSGLLKNRHLAKSISDASWGSFLTKLKYKSENTRFLNPNGVELLSIDRFAPSSKTCARCGSVKDKLSLSERIFACGDCGYRGDRDLNAAINILTMAHGGSQGTAEEINRILYPWVTGESKLGRTGASKPSLQQESHSGAEPHNVWGKSSSSGNRAVLNTSSFSFVSKESEKPIVLHYE
jgi:putative transposase